MAESDGELDTRNLVKAVNRKRKASAGGWQSMGLDYNVTKGVEKRGYKAPTPIQRKSIPIILDGKDVVAMARTGSGKTAAFIIPMLQKLKCRQAKGGCRAILISPTRELALQTFRFVKELGKWLGTLAAVVVGGDSLDEQFSAIHSNPDIVVATPGRLLHLIMEMKLKLDSVQYVVFDEADRLFEMGFAEQLNEIIRRFPENRQSLLFSATLPKSLVDFARAGLNDPVLVRLDVDTKISDKLDMQFLMCRGEEKIAAVLHILSTLKDNEQCMIFVATKHHVEYMKELIQAAAYDCTYLYSSLDPLARKINASKFHNKQCQVLVVTDVAARGVDIPLLDCVINVHFPPKPKLFVHRVGRVARAGKSGRAVSLVSPDEQPYLLDLLLFLGRSVKVAGPGVTASDVVGTLSRDVLASQMESIYSVHQTPNVDWAALAKCQENAYKMFLKSKPSAALASVRRLKIEKMFDEVPLHPMFSGDAMKMSTNALLTGLHNYKPQLTVFEFNTSSKTKESSVMKSKRLKHSHIIETTKKNLNINRPTTNTTVVTVKPAPQCSQEDITETFSLVIAPKFYAEGERIDTRKKKPRKRDTEFFVPYAPLDVHSEAGLAVEKGFDSGANRAVVDFIADEEREMRNQIKGKHWDRKKKKFVGADESTKVNKIRTETGAYIPASYVGDKYNKWKQKQRINTSRDNDDRPSDGPNAMSNIRGRKWRFSKEQMGKVKDERRQPEQILKERKQKAKIRARQNGKSKSGGKSKPSGKSKSKKR